MFCLQQSNSKEDVSKFGFCSSLIQKKISRNVSSAAAKFKEDIPKYVFCSSQIQKKISQNVPSAAV